MSDEVCRRVSGRSDMDTVTIWVRLEPDVDSSTVRTLGDHHQGQTRVSNRVGTHKQGTTHPGETAHEDRSRWMCSKSENGHDQP